jgi:hypothetical protein
MSVSNELSSEIAAAILVVANEKSAVELMNLSETIIKVHSILQEMSIAERIARYDATVTRQKPFEI